MLYACKATVKDSEVTVADVLPLDEKSPKATVTITTKKATRKLVTSVQPYHGTVILVFDSYAEGDQKPATEKLTKGKSAIVRLVTIGDKDELYAVEDFWGKGSDLKPSTCVK
jgi:hypothetical protein